MENLQAELLVDQAEGVHLLGEPEHTGPARFRFHLCRKQTDLGELAIDQFWMRQHGLYGERNQTSRNRRAIIDYFWGLCFTHGTFLEADVRETLLLAEILPHARSNGSRRVFADATLTRPEQFGERRDSIVAELDGLLRSSRDEQLTEIAFRDRTAALLGPPEYEEPVWQCYHRFCEEVLEEGREGLLRADREAVQTVIDRWADIMRRIGRRSSHDVEKQALDILSYEARAAFHRCYAAVWLDLIPHLVNKYHLSEESAIFHRFWHLLRQRSAAETDAANFYPFHGHIFGLHPACGMYMLAETGRQQVGDWVRDPQSVPEYQRLLHGLFVALHHYAQRHEVYALLRRREPDFGSGHDLARLEEQQVERRTGRRRDRRRETDAR